MQLSCPCCHERFPIEAGILEDDGKRLAALLADMEPVLGRAVIGYLRLFKPAKQGLRTARAVKIVHALDTLVRQDTVCKDERGGVRRPASPAMWADGIEHMLTDQARLSLPLANHNYLRSVVYGIADKVDADAERKHEEGVRSGMQRRADRSVEYSNRLNGILHDLQLGLITDQEAEHKRAQLREEFSKS